MKKKTIYLLVITIVTVICVIWGTMWNTGFGFGFHHYEDAPGYVQKSSELDAFDSITVDTDVTDIEIKEGTGFALEYSCTENLVPEFKVEKGTLQIYQRKNREYHFSMNNCDIIVTLPAGTSLKNITVQSDVGDVTVRDITADYFKVDVNVGEITAINAALEEMVLFSDTGDISVRDCEFTSIDAQGDVSEIDIESSRDLTGYDLDLTCDVGEIKVNNETMERKYKRSGEAGKVIAETEVGDIKIEY